MRKKTKSLITGNYGFVVLVFLLLVVVAFGVIAWNVTASSNNQESRNEDPQKERASERRSERESEEKEDPGRIKIPSDRVEGKDDALNEDIRDSPPDTTHYIRPRRMADNIPLPEAPLAVQMTVVDAVVNNTNPNLTNTDTAGDGETNIAINPANPNEIVMTAFSGSWGANSPWWHSLDAGQTWTERFTVPVPTGAPGTGGCPCDQSIDYGRSNRLAGVFMSGGAGTTDTYTGITTNPALSASFNYFLVGGNAQRSNLTATSNGQSDQPWLLVNPAPGNPSQDNTYTAYDDFGTNPVTMQVAVAAGSNPPNFTIDNSPGVSGGNINPGHRMAEDPASGAIYSLWQQSPSGDDTFRNINYRLNRSTDGGVTWTLNGNAGGIIVANADSTQPRAKFGTVNALLGGVDHAAVDPATGDLYYVYGNRDSGTGNNRLAIRRLTTNGLGVMTVGPEVFVNGQVQSAIPSVAVNSDGVVGVFYYTYNGIVSGFPQFTARVAFSTDQGASFSTDVALQTFASSATDNGNTRQRVLGDYMQMKSVGKTFYGSYTGNGATFGRAVSNHDPIFFKVALSQIGTSTLVSSGTNPSVFGQPVTFTATVSATQNPTGTVSFLDGATPIAACQNLPINGSGQAQCPSVLLSTGPHTINANYSGDVGFNPSTGSVAQTVNKAATTTTLISDVPDPTVFGQNYVVAFSVAVVGPGVGTPTGNVTVSDGTNSCIATVAVGQCSMPSTSVGPKNLTASYAGDTNFVGSVSPGSSHTVNKADTLTTITTDLPDPSFYGAPVTVNYTVVAVPPGAGTPTGNVVVTVSGGAETCTGTVAAGSCVITLTSVGARTLTAVYVGDMNFNGSNDTEPHVVIKANTTTAIVSDLPDPTVFGQNYTVTTSVAPVAPGAGTPTGNVTVTDGTNSCVAVLPATSCQLASTSVGAKTLTATFSGDGNFNGSVSPTAQHTVNKADSATSVQVSMNAPTYGQTATMTATLTAVAPGAGVPLGTVSFNDGGFPIVGCQNVTVSASGAASCSTTALPAGVNKTIQAVYSGDANFNGSNGSTLQTINKAPLNVTASSATVTYGDAAPAITSSITGFVLGETSAVLGTQPACSTTYTQGASAAGSQYPTSCTGGVAANYSFNYINGTVTVNKKALTVTADNKTRVYGAANPTLTATFSGFIPGENLGNSGITGSPLLTTTAIPTSPVAGSPYAITAAVGTLASANYSFATFVNGTLTITAAQLTVTADSKTRVFGAANPALTYQIAGFQNGETLGTSGVTGTPAISTTATATSSPGTYPITVTTGTLGAPNYTFAFLNANLTVTQATTTTTITNSGALGNTTAVGQSYAVTWTTTPNAPGAGTPTGTVTVSDGTGATCSAPVATGTCNLTSTTIGTKTITATYAGDANFAGSVSQTVNHTVVIAMTGNVKQFIAFGTNTNLGGVTITISGTVTGTTTTDAAGNYSFGLTALGGNYVLTPSGLGKTYEAISRTYNNVNGNIAGADFIAYDSPGPNAIPRTARLVSQIATQGQPVTLPILMSTTGAETRVSFTIEYPTTALGIPTVACGSGTINCTLALNNSLAGRMGVTITPTGPLAAGTAEIARITFPTFPSSASNAAIRFGDFPTAREVRNAENNPIPILYWTDGQVSFTGGTLLDGATMSGRVLTANGQGVRNATVTIIDPVGNRKTAVTSSFGTYQFEGLELGRTYLVTVNSKRFRFAARTVELTDNLSNIDVVGLE